MTLKQAKLCVVSVLQYYDRLERAAVLRRDRLTVLHVQECWLLVHDSFFRCFQVPRCRRCDPLPVNLEVVPAARPRWFREKYARPTRKVVARTSRTFAGHRRGEKFTVNYDVLECGHQVEDRSVTWGTKPARHRRCGECGGVGACIQGKHLMKPLTKVVGSA